MYDSMSHYDWFRDCNCPVMHFCLSNIQLKGFKLVNSLYENFLFGLHLQHKHLLCSCCLVACLGSLLQNFFLCNSEQQPLRLNQVEVCEVIAAVCSETPSPNTNHMTISSKLSSNSGKPSADVAVSVLVKLVIDMYAVVCFFISFSTICSSMLFCLTKWRHILCVCV